MYKITGQESWYILYGSDGNGGYSYSNIPVQNPEGDTRIRGGFNLHKGTMGNGYVTLPSGTQDQVWNSLENTLINTPKTNYNNSTYIGIMIVLEK